MGIPSYFSYIIRNYKGIITPLDKSINFKHLFMDCNSIIYDCLHNLNNPTDNEVISTVIQKIKYYIKTVNPSHTIFIAFDGVAPFAKMEQQRVRRYKNDFLGRVLSDDTQEPKWNTSKITPGTLFMKQLSYQISMEFKNFKNENSIKNIIVSAANEEGEGEHKIFQYIRENPLLDDDVLIYGLDSDLFMLSIFNYKYVKNFYIFRETPEFLNTLIDISDNVDFHIVDIFKLRTAILSNMGFHDPQRIYDYAFLCFLLGNDFLPHFPSLNIRTHGIQTLLDIYNEYFKNKNSDFLVSKNGIQWKHVEYIIKRLSILEKDFLIEEINMRKKFDKWDWKEPNTIDEKAKLIDNFPILYRAEEIYINPGFNGWEDRYYKVLFPMNNKGSNPTFSENEKEKFRKEICLNYFEGLEWVYKYYIGNPIDWRWKYKYNYGPLFTDLKKYIPRRELIKNNRLPFSSDEQLIYVLPRTQYHLLPNNLSLELNNIKSNNKMDFQWAFCKKTWESKIKY